MQEENQQPPTTRPDPESQSPIQPPSIVKNSERVIQPIPISPANAAPGLVSTSSAEAQPQDQNSSNAQTDISARQPVVELPNNAAQEGPVVMYGHNEQHKAAGPRHIRWGVIGAVIALLVLLVGVALYLWILPTVWANAYLKNIKPLYQQQANQMTTVYQSIGRPVFTSNTSSLASDSQDLAYISGVIQTATHNTNTLETKDHLTVLLGTTWLRSVSQANTKYQAMQQYVSDSQAFLGDYKSLDVYVKQIEQIAETQLPTLVNDTNVINKGTSSKPTFIADIQQATASLQSFMSQVKGLKPPADLEGFNKDLLNDLSSMNGALQAQAADLQSNNGSDFNSQTAIYVSAYNDFVSLLNSNPTANIQTSSTIHGQITILQGEHPLQ